MIKIEIPLKLPSLNDYVNACRTKDIVQTNNLKKCKNCGLDAYFLIYNDEKVKQIDVDYVIDVLISGTKSVRLDKYESWKMMEVIKC